MADEPPKVISYRPDPETRAQIEQYAADRLWSLNIAVDQLVRFGLLAEKRRTDKDPQR